MIKQHDEEVWTWFQHITKFHESGIPQKQFAEREKEIVTRSYVIVVSKSINRKFNLI